jgi:large subunit ribosomal protein L6e
MSEHKEVKIGGEKNGQTRLVPVKKAPRFYPAEDVRQPKKSRKIPKPTALRSKITPGTVLILLAGRFRGKRVVFLKQLESGLLLVTGPYKINGVPLRRVNQAYVIATSKKIDISGAQVRFMVYSLTHNVLLTPAQLPEKLSDSYFARGKASKSQSAEEEFFADGKPKPKEAYPEEKASEQKEVDKVVLAEVKKTPILEKYLKATWSLQKGQYPHEMVF